MAENSEEIILTGPAVRLIPSDGNGIANGRGAGNEAEAERIMIGASVPIRSRNGARISNAKQLPKKKETDAELLIQLAEAISRFHTPFAMKGALDTKAAPGRPMANEGYDPNQPRVAAGQSGGGQWTSGTEGGGGSGTGKPETNPLTSVVSRRNTLASRQVKIHTDERKECGTGLGKPISERDGEANRLTQLVPEYLSKAHDEEKEASLAPYQSDEYKRHKLAAESARNIAQELQRRAHILSRGTESNYRQLMINQYGTNNPDLDKIAAFYAKKFNDQATLNWLSLQHPAHNSQKDTLDFLDGIGNMLLGGASAEPEEEPKAGSLEESLQKSLFEKVSDIEQESEESDPRDSSTGKNGTKIQEDANLRKLTPGEEKTYARVEPRESTRNAVWEMGMDKEGVVHDAVTGEIVKPGSPWVMGHKTAFELRKMQVDAANRGISREEFIEEQNNPNIYQVEKPGTSSRGLHEAAEHIQLPPGAAGTSHEDKY